MSILVPPGGMIVNKPYHTTLKYFLLGKGEYCRQYEKIGILALIICQTYDVEGCLCDAGSS